MATVSENRYLLEKNPVSKDGSIEIVVYKNGERLKMELGGMIIMTKPDRIGEDIKMSEMESMVEDYSKDGTISTLDLINRMVVHGGHHTKDVVRSIQDNIKKRNIVIEKENGGMFGQILGIVSIKKKNGTFAKRKRKKNGNTNRTS